MLRQLVFFICSTLLGTQATAAVDAPGVALSFDDDFVDQWTEHAPLLERYEAHATFYVTRYHQLSEEGRAKLHDLQDRGHEIGYHSVSHLNAEDFLATHTLDEYLTQEIDPGLADMNDAGFFPSTFAYPWNGRTAETDHALTKRFGFVRGSGRLRHGDTYIFQPDRDTRLQNGASIDEANFDAELLERALDSVRVNGKGVVILFAHQITSADTAHSHIKPETLERVLRLVREKGLKFYAMSELAPTRAPGHEVIYRALTKGTVPKADLIRNDIFPVDRFADTPMPGGPRWTEDPFGEKYWRFLFYSLRSLSHLTFAFDATGDRGYLDRLGELTGSFLDGGGLASPAAQDPHTAAFLTMKLVEYNARLQRAGAQTGALARSFSQGVRDRAQFLVRQENFEPHYNHGLTEAAALLMAASIHPYLAEAPTWSRTAIERLAGVVTGLIDADGVQVEQSPFYHFYVLKFLAEIDRWAANFGVDLAGMDLHGTVRSMLPFAARIALPDGALPHISSSTDYNVQKDSVLDAVNGMNAEFDFVRSRGANGTAPVPASKLFPNAGFAMLRTPYADVPFANATQIVFDVGPFRTTHSQADALNLVFYAERSLLVDSGLFSYESSPSRTYYAGTAAHNTVVVDGRDQAKGVARPVVFATDDAAGWAYQSGEHSLYPGVHHKRGVLLVRRGLALVIDRLNDTSGAAHRFEQFWHLAPDLALRIDGYGSAVGALSSGATALRIVPLLVDGITSRAYRGETAPKQGWVSELYEKEEPAAVVGYERTGSSAMYVTLLVGGNADIQARVVDAGNAHIVVELTDAQESTQIAVDAFDTDMDRVTVGR